MKTSGMQTILLLTILSYLSEAQPTDRCTSMGAHACAQPQARGQVLPLARAHTPVHARAATLLQTQERGSTSINLTDLIYKIYYINLDGSTDRRASMEGTLSELSPMIGVTHERFAGVYGKLDSWCIQKAEGRTQVLGNLGCFRSHLSVWEKALAEEPTQPWIMVMEDDAFIPDARKFAHMRELLEYVPSDADIVLLGPKQKPGMSPIVAQGVINKQAIWVVSAPGLPSFSAYLVKISSINKIVPALYGQLNISAADYNTCLMHVDCASSVHPSIRKYALIPGIVSLEHDLAHVSARDAANH